VCKDIRNEINLRKIKGSEFVEILIQLKKSKKISLI